MTSANLTKNTIGSTAFLDRGRPARSASPLSGLSLGLVKARHSAIFPKREHWPSGVGCGLGVNLWMAPVAVDERLANRTFMCQFLSEPRPMSVAFQKWGNGLALRGPQMFADESGASDGKPGEMTMSDGKLVIAQAALCRTG